MTSLHGQEPPACADDGDCRLHHDGARQTVWTRNMKVGSELPVGDSEHAVSDLYLQPTLSVIHSLDNRRRVVAQSEDLCTRTSLGGQASPVQGTENDLRSCRNDLLWYLDS